MIDSGTRVVESNTGYKNLLCYKKALVVYDLTYHFCTRFMDKHDRTFDQMVQAARSVKQNIVEGSVDMATSSEMALKLLNIARGSLHELLADYEDYLRTRRLVLWPHDSREVLAMQRIGREHDESDYFITLAESREDDVVANMAVVLIYQCDVLLRGYIDAMGSRFANEGGFREKLTRIRLESRKR